MKQMDLDIKELNDGRSKTVDDKKNSPIKCTKCNQEDHLDWGCRQGQDVTCYH